MNKLKWKNILKRNAITCLNVVIGCYIQKHPVILYELLTNDLSNQKSVSGRSYDSQNGN